MARIKIKGRVSTGKGKKKTVGKTGKKLYESRAQITTHLKPLCKLYSSGNTIKATSTLAVMIINS